MNRDWCFEDDFGYMRRIWRERGSTVQPVGTLTVNLSAISQNWLMMCAALQATTRCAAVVKANAYGLGVARVAQALYAAVPSPKGPGHGSRTGQAWFFAGTLLKNIVLSWNKIRKAWCMTDCQSSQEGPT